MLQIDQLACFRTAHPFERCGLLFHRFVYEAVNGEIVKKLIANNVPQFTVATPCTCAVVPSGNVIIDGLFVSVLGSTWISENVPSPLVCKTV